MGKAYYLAGLLLAVLVAGCGGCQQEKLNHPSPEQIEYYNQLYQQNMEVPKIKLIDFDKEFSNFIQWMENKGYHEKVIEAYQREAKDPELRRWLAQFLFYRHVYGVKGSKTTHGIYLFRQTSPIHLTWVEVIPADQVGGYLPLPKEVVNRYERYLTERFGKRFEITFKRRLVNYSRTWGDQVFEGVHMDKQDYIGLMKEKHGANLEGMSQKEEAEFNSTLARAQHTDGQWKVENPHYFANQLEDFTANTTPPCVYRFAITEYQGRQDFRIKQLRHCVLIMNVLGSYRQTRPATGNWSKDFELIGYFDEITEELGVFFRLHREHTHSGKELEYSGIMGMNNKGKSKHGAWVSPLIRYTLEPIGGYLDDPARVEVGFGERYNRVMSWKINQSPN